MKKNLLFLILCLLTISFSNAQLNTVAIIGSGTPNGWPTGAAGEVDAHQMTSTDKINWTISNLTLTASAIKFRGNNSWILPYNWGGTNFPSGTAVVDGNGITAVAGNYDVGFNSTTGVYNFVLKQSTFPIVSIIGDATPGGWTDTDMSTSDGINYTIKRVVLTSGAIKFRQDHAWTLPYNWGGTDFPTGTAVVDANGIPAKPGTYNIAFNKNTRVYSFTFPGVAIIGPGAGGWPSDPQIDARQLITTDGVNYALNNLVLTGDDAKFRANNSWTINWGATSFPSGTAVLDSPNSFKCVAGTYSLAFNYNTGAYTFTGALGTKAFELAMFSVYPNPTQNSWNLNSSKESVESIQIIDITGKIIKTIKSGSTAVNIDASDLNSGIYYAKIITGTSTSTIKLLKK